MPCEHYKDALIEAAAAGAAPTGELRMHLSECASCRAVLAEEQALFAAIDCGLQAAVNVEVPRGLLPQVRARLGEAVARRLGWLQPLVFASAGLALVFAVFLMTRPHPTAPEYTAKQDPVVVPPPTGRAAKANPEDVSSRGTPIAVVRVRHSHAAQNSTNRHSPASSNLEVLVPPGTEAAFLRSLPRLLKDFKVSQQWQEQGKALEIKPLAIEEISSAPLSSDESDSGSNGGIGQFRALPPAGSLRAQRHEIVLAKLSS
jgi:hypothetical protein